MIPGIQEIKSLAVKYSKKQLANMAQMGLIDPQKAVMAGMMRDRIAKEDMQPPSTTVAQDVLGMSPQPQMGMQPQPQMAQAQPQMGAPVEQPPVMAASGGLTNLPVEVQDYAGGGIVAFADRGLVEDEAVYDPLTGALISGPAAAPYRRKIKPGAVYEPSLIQDIFSGRPVVEAPPPQSQAAPTTTTSAPEFKDARRAPPPAPGAEDEAGLATIAPRGTRGPAAPTGKSMILDAPTFKPYDMNAVKLKGSTLTEPKIDELKDIRAARRAVEAEEGVDPEMYDKMIRGVEEKKGKLEGRKGEAAGQALMMAGLGLIGARRGEEFQALGAAGQKALNAYKDDMKDLRNASEKYDERMEALRIADQQAKKTNSAADIAKREAQEARAQAAKLEVYKAENELARTGAQVSATVYGAELKRDVDLFQTRQAATTAQEQLKMDKYKADLAASVQRGTTAAIKQQGLDERRARTLIEAADSFIKNNINTRAYLENPQLLQQDAIAFANKLAGQFMPGTAAARNAPSATPSNKPPLSSFNK